MSSDSDLLRGLSSHRNTPATPKPYARNGEVTDASLFPEGMRRIAMAIEYNGAEYRGFQTQKSGVPTVQQHLEKALTVIANEPITLVCAGRTDAGVHATNQIVHFDTTAERPERAWTLGVRQHMPHTISVRWATEVSCYFHARFSALARTYRYILCNTSVRPALMHDQLTWPRHPLNVSRMQKGAEYLLGEHDFTSFRAAQCQAKSPVRRIEALRLVEQGNFLVLEITATAFLHHMVRNIVGVLMEVGAGFRSPDWVAEVLAAKNRSAAAATAPPYGLYLVQVGYPKEFNLPVEQPGPWFFTQGVGDLGSV